MSNEKEMHTLSDYVRSGRKCPLPLANILFKKDQARDYLYFYNFTICNFGQNIKLQSVIFVLLEYMFVLRQNV